MEGALYREFTKSLIFRDFDDVLKNSFWICASFSITYIIIKKKISKIAMHDL